MKIWLLSDLHNENDEYRVNYWGAPDDADIAICAGDIARGGRGHVEWLKANIAPHTRLGTVSVLGNHEFYRGSMERERIEAGRASARGNVRVLDDMTHTVEGVRFVGATLWTDYRLYDPDDNPLVRDNYMRHARDGMNDHRLIQLVDSSTRRFLPEHALAIHKRSLEYLERVLSIPFPGETVVVTHHCPSPGSVHPVFQGDSLTPAFASDLDWLIRKYQPSAWIHGHTHSSFDYQLGSTRVVCNPRGYGRENKDFDPHLCIDIGDYAPRPRGL